MDFGQIQATASANTAKDHFELDEGETLVLLIPFPDGWENGRTGIPWVTHDTVGGDDVFSTFKRPIMSTNQPYCETDFYRGAANAAGKLVEVIDSETGEVTGYDHAADVVAALVDAGKMSERDAADSGKEVCGWAVCKIADRRRSTDRWSFAFQKPQIARFVRGNNAKPGPQRIIEGLLALGNGPAMMGELSEALDLIAANGSVESPVHARLVKLTRVGKGQRNTVYGGELANTSDGAEYMSFEIPALMLDEIARVIKPGGYCNLHTYFAERSIPSIQEIESKVYGKGKADGEDGDKPSMREVA